MKCQSLLKFPRKEKGNHVVQLCNGELKYNDSWKPGPGMNPRLRRFDCLKCGADFYMEIDPNLPKELIEKGVHDGSA